MLAKKQDTDHTEPRLRKFLDAQKTFNAGDHAALLLYFSKHRRCRRFTSVYVPPWNSPLTLKGVAGALSNEKNSVCLPDDSADADYCFGHERIGSLSMANISFRSAAVILPRISSAAAGGKERKFHRSTS